MIPKIIHYCWLSGDPIPESLQTHMKTWKEKLPDYEFILWDKNRFDIHSLKWTEQAYDAKKYAFAADYIRLYAIYNYGGIYMDMDVEVVKSFNDLLDRPYIMGVETSELIEAGIFGAEKGCELMKWCLEFYKDRNFPYTDENGRILGLPVVMTEQISRYIPLEITEKPDFSKKALQLLPFDYLTAKSGDTGIVKKTKHTYSVHHFAGSWLPRSRKHELKVFLANLLGERIIRAISNILHR